MIENLEGAPPEVMTALAKGRRFTLTVPNTIAYVATHSLDGHLISFLEHERTIRTEKLEDPTQRETLAAQLLNEKKLTVVARIDLATSLVDTTIPINRITSREPELIRSLVEHDLIDDNASTFTALAPSDTCQVAFIAGSSQAPEFFTQLIPTAAVTERLLGHDDVADEVKSLIAENLPRIPQNATGEVIEGLASWTERTHAALPLDTIQLVQSSSASTEAKLKVLEQSAPTLPTEAVFAYVALLPVPYSRLLERSSRPVDLPAAPEVAKILHALEADGTGPVSSSESGRQRAASMDATPTAAVACSPSRAESTSFRHLILAVILRLRPRARIRS